MTGLNSFQRKALLDLKEACFEASPRANWVEVWNGYRWEPIFTVQGVDQYIAENYPLSSED